MLINYKSNKVILAMAFLMTTIGFTSCSSDDDSASNEIVLESFGPTGAHHGEAIVFIGRNLDKVTSIVMTGATVESGQFTSQTDGQIQLIIPMEAQEGKVTLKTPAGDIQSKTVLSFEVPVVIDSYTLEVKPGETMTISGEFVSWITTVWFDEIPVTEFVSKSRTEIVIDVPLDAKSGKITFLTGGTEPLEIEPEEGVTVILPAIGSFSPNPVARGEDLTITGTDLDLVMGISFKGLTEPIMEFNLVSSTEIIVTVPEDANQGKISLVAFSGIAVDSEDALELEGALPPLDALDLAFFVDALQNGWQKWGGWGNGSSDIANSDNVRDGEKAIKVVFADDWGGPLQLGGGSSSTTGFTKVSFSVFGGAGTGGKELNVIVAGKEKIITVTEDEWVEFNIPLSDFNSPATINEFTLQSRGWAGTIYMDHVGLRD